MSRIVGFPEWLCWYGTLLEHCLIFVLMTFFLVLGTFPDDILQLLRANPHIEYIAEDGVMSTDDTVTQYVVPARRN